MTKRKGIRTLAALALCFALCISFTVPAFAYADDTEQELPVTEATQPEATPETAAPEEPEPYEGEPIEGEGNAYTRDLLYDKNTNKQFISVQTSGGNTFYIVIDYDKPTDEDGEQYQTYFLNMVDEADLLAAMQAAGGELPECSCADKCAVGAINTDCTVCAVNMGECQGKAPEPSPVVEPEPDPEPEQPKATGNGGMLLLALAVAVIGGGTGWYFKIYRPKKQQAADAAEDYGDDYDDTPPWEDEDETESEGEE